jgi:tripartite-type tricarboxylate transporter receptor subunit TctC
MFDAVPTMAEHIRSGRVKALATTGATRSSVLANVPTVAESGVPGYEATIWLGILAPKGTPPAVANRVNAEVGKLLARPDVRDEWAKQGATPMLMNVDQFGRYLTDDIAKWERIVKVSGAKPDQ